MSGPDALFNVHNNFYLGAYQMAITEASSANNLVGNDAADRDCYLYRSYIALGSYQLAMSEITDEAPTSLQAVKLLATYLSDDSKKEKVMSTMQEWLADPSCSSNITLLLMASILYSNEGNDVEALKCCHSASSLELMALSIQIFLKMNRADCAEKQLKAMMNIDDDATLTQLAQAWTNIAMGGSKIQEAFYIFQELGDKYQWTVKLYNGSAVCNMQMGNFEEAERELLEALNKDSKDAETLANLAVLSLHLGKPNTRYLNSLKMVSPNHALLAKLESCAGTFDRAAADFTV